MQVNVMAFGQLAEITGKEFLVDAMDTSELSAKLEAKHAALKNTRYIIAVNKKIISVNTPFTGSDSVALLPPFSGG
jgi:molybdopterin synthase sulfur carrier subunit